MEFFKKKNWKFFIVPRCLSDRDYYSMCECVYVSCKKSNFKCALLTDLKFC